MNTKNLDTNIILKNFYTTTSILIISLLLFSCSKTVSYNEISFNNSKVEYDGKFFSGEAIENYENGGISKVINVKNGIVLNQTHFSESGDTIATMYYYPDGSFNNYQDKTVKNNEIDFECLETDNGSSCAGSRNVPDAKYRLARIIDWWIEENGLMQDYKNTPSYNWSALTKPSGGVRMGRMGGKATMLFSGSAISSVESYDSQNYKEIKGPFYADNVLVTVEYSMDGFNKQYMNENAELTWLTVDSEKSMYSGDPSPLIMRAFYKPVGGGSSAGAELRIFYFSDSNKIKIQVRGAGENPSFIYAADIMNFDYALFEAFVLGKNIYNKPGYDYNNFNLYWNGNKDQGFIFDNIGYDLEKVVDEKIYKTSITYENNYLSDGNIVLRGSGETFYIGSSYTTSPFYDDYKSIFQEFEDLKMKNSISYQSLFEGENALVKGKIYEIEYIKRNWVENYENPSLGPASGNFLINIKR